MFIRLLRLVDRTVYQFAGYPLQKFLMEREKPSQD